MMIKAKGNNKENCILRLSRYKNALAQFKKLGFIKIFSDNLAECIGVSPALVRKDFSMFDLTGNKKGGYEIDLLLEKLNKILGKDKVQKVILVGAGKIGTALLNYKGFEKEGIRIVAAFDVDRSKYNKKVSGISIFPFEEIKPFVKKHGIKIGIITTPDAVGAQVAELMISSGIKGILNFAPINLKEPEGVVIKNINIAIFLENVIYFVNAMEQTSHF